MPFGLVNGPVIFVVTTHDLKGHWDDLVREWGVGLGNFTNTIIIIHDTFIFSDDEDAIFKYVKAILEISKRYNLSWKLEKYEFFTPRFESVGIDIDDVVNQPVLSKTLLLEIRKTKKTQTKRDFASFIVLVGFYRNWIPFVEERITSICTLMSNHNYSDYLIDEDLTPEMNAEIKDLLSAVLPDPVLQRAYIKTVLYSNRCMLQRPRQCLVTTWQ